MVYANHASEEPGGTAAIALVTRLIVLTDSVFKLPGNVSNVKKTIGDLTAIVLVP